MSWGSSNDSNYGDSSGTSGSSSSSGSKGSSGGKYSIYINIGLAILAVLILLFLIGAYYNKKSDKKKKISDRELIMQIQKIEGEIKLLEQDLNKLTTQECFELQLRNVGIA